MADEAFALSPISARASLPSEEDYEAISQAFMETSRGRWFLGEYAKRNRNADTRMVLDAVARIEETLAAQKQPASRKRAAGRVGRDPARGRSRPRPPPPRPSKASRRRKTWRRSARAPGSSGRSPGGGGKSAPTAGSAISWIPRSAPSKTRADKSPPPSPQAALSAAFDLIKARIAEFDDSDKASRSRRRGCRFARFRRRDEMPAAAAETAQAVSTADDTEAAMDMPAKPLWKRLRPLRRRLKSRTKRLKPPTLTTKRCWTWSRSRCPHRILTISMSLPSRPRRITSPRCRSAEPTTAAEPGAASPKLAGPIACTGGFRPSLEPSLGSSLIANGIVRRPRASDADPLAPIRRMSQAEKIAFFS